MSEESTLKRSCRSLEYTATRQYALTKDLLHRNIGSKQFCISWYFRNIVFGLLHWMNKRNLFFSFSLPLIFLLLRIKNFNNQFSLSLSFSIEHKQYNKLEKRGIHTYSCRWFFKFLNMCSVFNILSRYAIMHLILKILRVSYRFL